MTDREIMDCAIHTFQCEARALSEIEEQINQEQLLAVVKEIASCSGRILVAGCGGAGMIARRAVQGFNNVDRSAFFLSPGDAPHGDYGKIRPGDVLILVSKSGKTEELFDMIPIAHKRGARVISITDNASSPIARQSDQLLLLNSGEEACPYQILATSSAAVMSSVFDAIAICCMKINNVGLDYYKIIHPGGGVGARFKENNHGN